MTLTPTGFPGQHAAERPRAMLLGIGGVIAVLGAFALLLYAGWLPVTVDESARQLPTLLIGAGAVAIGLGVALFRRGFDVDTANREVRTWWRLGPLGSRRSHAFDQCDRVRLDTKVIRSNNSSQRVFLVQLEGRAGELAELAMLGSHRAARSLGEQVARLIERPLADATDGPEVVRQHDELDASLREQAARHGTPLTLPDPPPGTRCELRMAGDTVVVDIPAGGTRPVHWLVLGLTLAITTTVAVVFFNRAGRVPDGVRVGIVLAMLVVPIALVGGLVLTAATRRWTLQVGRDGITVDRLGLGARSQTIAADAVEEVLVGPTHKARGGLHLPLTPHNPITVISDDATMTFGESLERAEADYLRELVTAVLAAPR